MTVESNPPSPAQYVNTTETLNEESKSLLSPFPLQAVVQAKN